jgi:hypothetical protein
MGKIARISLNEGVKFGVSSRGVGSLKMTKKELMKLVKILCLQLLLISLLILLLLMLLFKELWKEKSGFGMVAFFVKNYAEKHTRESTLLVDQKRLEEHKLNLFNDFLIQIY